MSSWRDEEEALKALRSGNPEEFERFYRIYATALQKFLRRSLGDPKASEDITQEIFLELWRRPNGFNPARGSLRAYLYGIATKRAADWWRRRPPEVEPVSTRSCHQNSDILAIADAFEKMDPDKRSLLWLREIEGYSYQELAEMLAIPVGTVRSRLFAAREQLRRVWEGRDISEEL